LVRAATLADVGRAAGVSAMAASAVLNGAQTSSRIAETTRKRILAAAARLQYRPNAMAQALARRRMNTIGVAAVLDGELNRYIVEILTGILETAGHQKQNTTMFTLEDWDRDAARLHSWCDGRIDGLILLAPRLTRQQAKSLPEHTPFVALHAQTPLFNIINIETDEESGACEMVRYLIAQGHRRIMHLTGDRGRLGAERRVRGYKRALAEAGIPFSATLVVPASFRGGKGRAAMHDWIGRHAGEPLPQAIFCGNDMIAIECIEALAELGLRVPDDISVTGFDDTLVARTTVPQLTTVRQPLRAMGGCAVEALLKIIHDRRDERPLGAADPIVHRVELVMRASVAPPPSANRLAPPPRVTIL
jgi:LacI family transcriptional regulator